VAGRKSPVRVRGVSFLGFEYRLVLSRNKKWRPQFAPKLTKRTALFAELKEIFRRHISQPVGTVIRQINPILRGWVNYFRIGHSARSFAMVVGRDEGPEALDAFPETHRYGLEAVE
jgi:hypothetical protein